MALKEEMRAAKRPPNLRRGNARARCGTCKHFAGAHRAGTCQLYTWPVQASQVSDSWKAADA